MDEDPASCKRWISRKEPLKFDKMSEDVTQNHAQCIKILKFKRLAVQNFERQNRDLIFNQCG